MNFHRFLPPHSPTLCLGKTSVLTLYRKTEIHDSVMMPVQCGEYILFVVVEIPPMEKEKSTLSTGSSTTEQTKGNIELNLFFLTSQLQFLVRFGDREGNMPAAFQMNSTPSWHTLYILHTLSNLELQSNLAS